MKLIKENITLIFTIIVICVVFWWGHSCGRSKIIEPQQNTITLINYRDTVFPKDTIYKDTIIPKYIPKHDTIWLPLPKDSVDCERVFLYNDTISKKEYDVYTSAHVQGRLRALDVGVKLKVPIMIKDCTVVKKDSLVYLPNKYEIHAGLVASPVSLYPTVEMSVDKNTFGVGYDPFNKIPYISYKFRIISWTPKKYKK